MDSNGDNGFLSALLSSTSSNDTIPVKFSEAVISDLALNLEERLFKNENSRILHLSSDCTLLSAIKLRQALAHLKLTANSNYEYLVYKNDKIFTKSDIHDDFEKLFKNIFESDEKKLLIIVCQSTPTEALLKILKPFHVNKKPKFALFKLLKPFNTNKKSKKIILITQFDSIDDIDNKIVDDKIGFKHLDKVSQTKLLMENVQFQGNSIKLNQLISENVANELIDAKSLLQLMTDSFNIKIGNEMPFSSYNYKKELYIERSLSYVMVQTAVFAYLADKNLFYVTGYDPDVAKSDINKNCMQIFKDGQLYDFGVVLPPDECTSPEHYQNTFKKLCEQNPGKTINWLEYQLTSSLPGRSCTSRTNGKVLYWKGFIGDSSMIQNFIIKNSSKIKYNQNHIDIGDIKQKSIVIANDSGFGKSTFLISLAKFRATEKNSTWIIRIDLNDYSVIGKAYNLSKFYFSEVNVDTAIEFISKVALSNESTAFEKNLFTASIRHFKDFNEAKYPQIEIFFDGFDEISPLHKENTTKLLQTLKKTDITRFWITTCQGEKMHLKIEVDTSVFALCVFSEKDQQQFLTNYWQHLQNQQDKNVDEPDEKRLKLVQRNRQYFETMAKILVNWAKSKQDIKEDYSIAEIPLTLKLLAKQTFYQNFQIADDMLIDLHGKIIDDEIDQYCKKNKTEKNVLFTNLCDVHYELALKHIFPVKVFSSNFTYYESFKKICEDLQLNADQELIRLGLIKNDKHQFIHRCFAEYFVGEYLINNLTNCDEQIKKLVKNLIIEIFLPDDKKTSLIYGNIGQFLKIQLEKQKKMLEFVQILADIIYTRSICYMQKLTASVNAKIQFNNFLNNPKDFQLKICQLVGTGHICIHV